MIRSLSELKKEARVEGLIVVQSGKREARQDYIDALRTHYLKRDYPSGMPYQELSPMQAFDYYRLHPKQQKAMWKDRDWVVQEKLNGCRMIFHFIKGVGLFAHSRTLSVETYRRTEYTDHFLFESFVPDFSVVIDTEVMCNKTLDTSLYEKKGEITKSTLQSTVSLLHMEAAASKRIQREQSASLKVHVLDVTNWQGEDLRLKPLSERLNCLKEFQKAINVKLITEHFDFPPVFTKDKQAVLEKILKAGGEGVVLKNLLYHYEDSSSRSRLGWVKIKRQLEFDAYVSGFERGPPNSKWCDHVACLVFSVMTEEGHISIAKVSSLEWSFRKKISIHDRDNNAVKLDLDIYGRVARLSGVELSYKARRLMHPRIVYWNADLTQEKCLYNLADIEAVRRGATNILPLRVANSGSKPGKE